MLMLAFYSGWLSRRAAEASRPLQVIAEWFTELCNDLQLA